MDIRQKKPVGKVDRQRGQHPVKNVRQAVQKKIPLSASRQTNVHFIRFEAVDGSGDEQRYIRGYN